MKPTTLLLTLGLAVVLVSGCEFRGIRGNGNIKTESRPVSDFTRVDAGGVYKITWQPGPASLTITTDENLLSHIKTTSEGNVLKLRLNERLDPTEGIKVVLTSPSLSGADLSGAVKMEAASLGGDTFALETSGAAQVTLAGKVKRLLASLTGASKLHAGDLACETVEVSVTGAGKADVCATDRLRTAITGAGEVTYGCHPKSVEKKITGAGKIEARD
jgi:hypothetical protein